MPARHFNYKHPLFVKRKTKSGIWYEDSVYYLWFEYLKRNTEYKRYCETKKGKKALAELYKDFGDIHNTTFRNWWRDTGQDLFCETSDLERVIEIDNNDNNKHSTSKYVLNLAIPITKDITWLGQQVAKKLRERRRQLGITRRGVQPSTARYPLHTAAQVSTLKQALKVWDATKESTRTKKKTIEIAKELRIALGSKQPAQRRNTVWRLKRMAEQIIANTGKGEFPKQSVR